jgi:20S proteasome subunit alpha 3
LTADANILIDQARLNAARYAYQYQEPIPIENLVEHVCNYKQAYTQYGGLRPFGVAFLFAGYDEAHGFQLYQSDPSGNYSGWKATVIGANNQAGKSLLKTEYGVSKKDAATGGGGGDGDEMKMDDAPITEMIEMPDVAEACRLAVKVLNKTMDGAVASAEKLELFTMSLDENGKCVHKILTEEEAKAVIAEVDAESASAGDS